MGAAYLVTRSKSMMDYVQALFSFFIAPLFGCVVLGMLWKRVSRMGGFFGLLAGVSTSVGIFTFMKLDHRWVGVFCLSPLAQPLAQAMWQALWASITCVLVTVLVTLVTKPRPDQELVGLVYSLTEVPHEEHATIFHKPLFWGVVALALFVIIQIIFW
jgi:SSS family solute:Na+ symporter